MRTLPAPMVSIGLPFYNAAPTLADAIRSVFAQSYHDWELILVDDGSSDTSLDIARAVRDPRVRVLSDSVNKGLSARLNEIAHVARGRFIARMDSDDLMHPERLAKQVALLMAEPDIDIVGTATYTIDAAWRPLGIRSRGPLVTEPGTVLWRGLFVHPTVTARAAWVRANPYRPEYLRAQDLELWCRTCSCMSAALLPEPLHFYREPTPINLAGYLASCQTVRRIARAYGPGAGLGRTIGFLLRSHLTAAVYRLSGPLRLQHWLLRRRSTPLTDGERAHARTVLRAILATPAPGIDTTPHSACAV